MKICGKGNRLPACLFLRRTAEFPIQSLFQKSQNITRGSIETAHLLRSPANARRLLGALNRLEQGEGQVYGVEDLSKKIEPT